MSETSIAARMRQAKRALASSQTLLQVGDTAGACNRAYYAMFYAAHAALSISGAIGSGSIFKTHNGLIAIFSKELIRTDKVQELLGRTLSKVYDMRLLADYEGEAPKQPDAAWAIEQAEHFVATIEAKFFIERRS